MNFYRTRNQNTQFCRESKGDSLKKKFEPNEWKLTEIFMKYRDRHSLWATRYLHQFLSMEFCSALAINLPSASWIGEMLCVELRTFMFDVMPSWQAELDTRVSKFIVFDALAACDFVADFNTGDVFHLEKFVQIDLNRFVEEEQVEFLFSVSSSNSFTNFDQRFAPLKYNRNKPLNSFKSFHCWTDQNDWLLHRNSQ